jgi:hypothetical protein
MNQRAFDQLFSPHTAALARHTSTLPRMANDQRLGPGTVPNIVREAC